MILPNFYIQPVSIVVSVIVAFIFGGLWYGPLFGEVWARLIGMDMSKPPKMSEIQRGMFLSVLGSTFTSFVMCHLVQVIRPSSWGIVGQDQSPILYGFVTALFAWVGFLVPVCLNTVAWERRPWGLCFLNLAYWFFHLQIIAFVCSVTV
jgi:hypothetical protein